MSSLLAFFKKLKRDMNNDKRVFRHGDPAIGLEYNQICSTRKVSKRMYSVDIACTSRFVKDITHRADVQGECDRVNKYNSMVNYRSHQAKGRGIL